MCVAGDGLHLGVAKGLADHGKVLAERNRARSEALVSVVTICSCRDGSDGAAPRRRWSGKNTEAPPPSRRPNGYTDKGGLTCPGNEVVPKSYL